MLTLRHIYTIFIVKWLASRAPRRLFVHLSCHFVMADKAPGDMTVPDGIDFNHPYTPYDVQTDFMKTAYGVLQQGNGQVGILESPTGTVRCHELQL